MIQNKVAESALVTLDLTSYLPEEAPALFDIKPFLFRELILREKDFREALSAHDWSVYTGKTVLLFCSTDAIIPVWAYMLIVAQLKDYTSDIRYETADMWRERMMLERIAEIDNESFRDKRIVIKGCGDEKIPDAAFVAMTQKLVPVVKSIMYGEPCSTVPVYKKK
jgi:hypothetical protein